MLTFEEFGNVAVKINDYLNSFIELDSEIANVGLTKAYDFGSASWRCQEIANLLSEVQSQLSSCQGQQAGKENIGAAIRFVDTFIESVNQLAHISGRLQDKADGTKYGWFEYHRDMKEYRRLEKARSSLGQGLSLAFITPY